MPAVRFPVSARARLGVFCALAALAMSVATPATADASASEASSEIAGVGDFVGRAAPEIGERVITTRPTGAQYIGKMVVDSARQRIYISADQSILVTDLAGNVQQSLSGHTSAYAMVMVADTLYVLEGASIRTVNVAGTPVNGPTLTTVLPAAGYGLAYAGGALWTAVGPCTPTTAGTAAIARIDVTNGAVNTMTGDLAGLRCPVLDGAGNDLVVGDDGPQGSLRRYDVSGTFPTPLANTTIADTTTVHYVSIESGSSTVLVSYGPTKATESRDLSTLAPVTTYGTVAGETTTSSNARGGLVAVGGASSPNIAVHVRGSSTPMWSVTVSQFVLDLAFNTDASKLYAYVLDATNGLQVAVIDTDDPTFPVQSQYGEFHPIDPARVFDSRSGAPVAGVRNLQMTGLGGVPSSGVSAVAVNVTVTDAASAGYLSLYPGGTAQPNASTVNYQAGQIVPNMAIVGVSAQGQLSVYAYSPTHVIIDVVGWFGDAGAPSGGLFHPVTPFRWFDTRLSPRGDGRVRPVGPNQYVSASATGGYSTASMHMTALALNVTATNTTSESYLTVTPFGAPLGSSNLNWKAGDVVPNAVISKLESAQGRVQFTNAFGSTDVIVDSTGYWDDGALSSGTRFHPVEPRRLADTRTGYLAAGSQMGTATRLGPGQFISFKANGGLPSGATTAVLNVTAVEPSEPGYISAFPAGLDLKKGLETSLVNFAAGAIRPNMTIMPMGANGEIVVFNASNGTIDILVDMTGYFA